MDLKSRLLEKAVESLSSLPGIGKRTALRLVLNLLKKDKNTVQNFGKSFIDLVTNIKNALFVGSTAELQKMLKDENTEGEKEIKEVKDIQDK